MNMRMKWHLPQITRRSRRASSGELDHGFVAFCDGTSMAGFRHIGDGAGRGSHGRLFWSLVVMSSVVTCAWFCTTSLSNFFERTVESTIDTTTACLDQVYFPSVTVCNINQVQQTFLNYLNMTQDAFQVVTSEFFNGRSSPTSKRDLDQISAVLNSSTFGYAASWLEYAYGSSDLKTLSDLLGGPTQIMNMVAQQPQPGQMVVLATFNGTTLVQRVTSTVSTDIGVCAQLNAYEFNHTMSIFTELPPVLPSQAQPGVSTGIGNGMTLLLDAEVYNYAGILNAFKGFTVALHHHQDMAVMRQMGFNVAPGTYTSVAITPILYSTTSGARTRFRPMERNCYYDNEIRLQHWWYNMSISDDPSRRSLDGRYSMSNCLMEAVIEQVASQCECAPSFNLMGFNLKQMPVCRGQGITCMNKMLGNLGSFDSVVDRGTTKQCLAPCTDQVNEFHVTAMKYPQQNTFTMRTEICYVALNLMDRCTVAVRRQQMDKFYPQLCASLLALAPFNQSDCAYYLWLGVASQGNNSLAGIVNAQMYEYAEENLVMLVVWIRDPYATSIRRGEASTVVDFVGGLGGLLGLCTGFSLISGVEIGYYLIDYVIHVFFKRRTTVQDKF